MTPPRTPAIAAELRRLSPDYAPTPLLNLPQLARKLGIARVLAKNEGLRALGSFKSLGGTYAGLRALARAAGTDVATLLAQRPPQIPALICASDGNHGLAVAAAARYAGASARIYLPAGVPPARARRIADMGAEIAWVNGTYDDAVDAAAKASQAQSAILIADTSADAADPVVADVMDGYGVIAMEIREQAEAAHEPRPTHLFVQAGVGGLAAALAAGLQEWLAPPARIVVVEPETAACLAPALAAGEPVRIGGSLETTAGMLSCGEASAPALRILQRHHAEVVTVSEQVLTHAPNLLRDTGGPDTTPSGAAGLAGIVVALSDVRLAEKLELSVQSRSLIVLTETNPECKP